MQVRGRERARRLEMENSWAGTQKGKEEAEENKDRSLDQNNLKS